jgi:WD40 repeat protein
MDGKIFIFNNQNGQKLSSLEGPTEIVWLKWHPKGNVLLAGSEDGTVWMWSIPSGACMSVFTGHLEQVSCGDFTPDGN